MVEHFSESIKAQNTVYVTSLDGKLSIEVKCSSLIY